MVIDRGACIKDVHKFLKHRMENFIAQQNQYGFADSQITIPYPTSEYTKNSDGVSGGVYLLSGPDNGETLLWWETNKGNANHVNC